MREKKKIIPYTLPNGKKPFSEWFDGLKDPVAVAAITRRLRRLQEGNYGDWKSVTKFVKELRVTVGPGYRIYITECGGAIVILLCAGDKKTQKRDIERANDYAEEIQKQRRKT